MVGFRHATFLLKTKKNLVLWAVSLRTKSTAIPACAAAALTIFLTLVLRALRLSLLLL
jgi:hypothetical protein